ncbi:MAG: four helix bundle protein [Candidatus Zambryskibacteria bacterium]|nr:four helix bundle protein [Candidatus Zambryskibacteria bacterium]
MTEHSNLPPPAKAPSVLFKAKETYSYWLKLYRKIAKPERFGIGEKIDILFLEILELMHSSRYAPVSEKLPYLEKTIGKIDKIKFFLEISWENELMSSGEYALILERLEGMGRELGGWKKGIVNKNPMR